MSARKEAPGMVTEACADCKYRLAEVDRQLHAESLRADSQMTDADE